MLELDLLETSSGKAGCMKACAKTAASVTNRQLKPLTGKHRQWGNVKIASPEQCLVSSSLRLELGEIILAFNVYLQKLPGQYIEERQKPKLSKL